MSARIELIHCFKENTACSSGVEKLKGALQVIYDESTDGNPFSEPTDSDIEEACQPFHLLDEDEECDDIDIE